MRTKKSAVRSRAARIGVVLAVTATGLVVTGSPSFAVPTPATLTPSVTQGPSLGTNTLSASVPLPLGTGVQGFATGSTFVEFQAVGTATAPAAGATGVATPPTAGTTGCWPTWLAAITPVITAGTTAGATTTNGVVPVTGNGTVVYGPNKIFITVPNGTSGTVASGALGLAPGITINSVAIPAQTVAKYNICVYYSTTPVSGLNPPYMPVAGLTGSPLIAQTTSAGGQYSIANKAVVSTISPASGPAQGKTTITVTGQNFTPAIGSTPTTMTATLGGLPLPITAVDPTGNSFTAVVPSHTASTTPVDLVVTTSGGTTIKTAFFTYTNGIVTQPDTEPNTQAPLSYIDVQGVGFTGLTFSATAGLTPDDNHAHVYLVNGVYDPTSTSAPVHKTRGETAECVDVRVVSDTELICSPYPGLSIDTTSGAIALGSHTLKVATTNTTMLLTPVAPDAFTSADIGLPVTGAGVGTNAVIQSVSGGVATVDVASGATASSVTVSVNPRTFAADTSSNTGLANVTPAFTAADVPGSGPLRVISSAGNIGFNTTLTAQTGAAGTLSANAVSTASTQTMSIGYPAPVPTGVYTVTVVSDGSVGATGFSQSIITSGSTYTVAPY